MRGLSSFQTDSSKLVWYEEGKKEGKREGRKEGWKVGWKERKERGRNKSRKV